MLSIEALTDAYMAIAQLQNRIYYSYKLTPCILRRSVILLTIALIFLIRNQFALNWIWRKSTQCVHLFWHDKIKIKRYI